MSILAQSLFALVSGHLVALLLLSVWHDFEILYNVLIVIRLSFDQRMLLTA